MQYNIYIWSVHLEAQDSRFSFLPHEFKSRTDYKKQWYTCKDSECSYFYISGSSNGLGYLGETHMVIEVRILCPIQNMVQQRKWLTRYPLKVKIAQFESGLDYNWELTANSFQYLRIGFYIRKQFPYFGVQYNGSTQDSGSWSVGVRFP